jgi:GH25 family lysozyme M1 (1,4-beta-N-acetylmuramidase)
MMHLFFRSLGDPARVVLRARPMRRGNLPFIAAIAVALSACSADPSTPSDGCTDKASEALRTCAGAHTLQGIDVSVYQGTVSWARVKKSGRTFAFARVSDGLHHHDAKFDRNWHAMRRAKIIRGAYQFFRPGQNAISQANLLLSAIKTAGGLRAGDLPPVLDIEVTDGESHATVVARAKTWLEHVHARTGRKPFVYTAAFMSSVIGSHLSAYPLWVANFGATCPTMPTGWNHWSFFQNHDNGRVPGVSGAVDTDVFDGTHQHLTSIAFPRLVKVIGDAPTLVDLPDADDLGPDDSDVEPEGEIVADGSQGATIGSIPSPDATPAETPCQR